MIDLQNISKGFGEQVIHQNLSMQVEQGQRLCLVGGSGVGKSLLMKLILGLEDLDEGEIYFEGQAISQLDVFEGFELMEKCGVVFQNAALFDSLTIRENVGLRLDEHGKYQPAEIDRMGLDVLSKVQLSGEILDLLPNQLSGGMQKRVAIARAIILHPSYLFYDEPTTGLDPENAAYIDDLILQLAQDPNTNSIIITHDLETILRVATQVAMLGNKGLIFHGLTQDFWQSDDPQIQAFLRRRKEA